MFKAKAFAVLLARGPARFDRAQTRALGGVDVLLLLNHALSAVYGLCLIAIASLQTGCNLQKFAADSTVKVVEAGSMGFNGFWDYEIFGQAIPGALLQSEALVQISPNNQTLLVGLSRSYISYAYGWLQDRWEVADDKGDFEAADELEGRIYVIYQRAAHLALRALSLRDKLGLFDQTRKGGKLDELKAYLRENFKEQDDVPALYFAGLAWGSAIANSGGDMNQLADAPFARALLERSVDLDPSYADAGALGVLGTVEGSFPELFGGNLETARKYYDRALEVCKRRNHLILLSYAKTYAVAKQDRPLFVKLLREILDSPDLGSDVRMSNKVARHRAKRYIKRVDAWFDPASAEPASPASAESSTP
jgi:tetratricopeptide (TPR) repeat protein